MSDIKQTTLFPKLSLNTDDSNLYIDKGSSPYFLNILVGEDGLNGVVTNAKGNKQYVYGKPLTLSNTYCVLGSYYNILTRKCYFFIFSQPYLDTITGEYLYDNRLLCFNEDTHIIDDIFYDEHNYFELDPTKFLTDIKMIDDWLFFNPVTAQPKMIDVVMAYNYTNYDKYDDTDPSSSYLYGDIRTYRGGLFVANTNITAFESPVLAPTKWDRIGDSYQDESSIGITDFKTCFYAIKLPPIDRISAKYKSDTTKNFNNVEGIVFRFSHRYQYFDNSYSVFSTYSNVVLPLDNELYNGEKTGATTRNNYIELSFSLYSAALVKNIEIIYQEIGGDWKRLGIINRRDQQLLNTVSYFVNFFNNESYPVIDQALPPIIEDYIPKLVNGQEIINKNILCYAGCTEGFDNIDKDKIDVNLTPAIHSIAETAYEGVIKRDNVLSNDITESTYIDDSYPENVTIYSKIINVSNWFSTAGVQAGDIYKIVIGGAVAFGELSASDVDTVYHLADAIAEIISQKKAAYAMAPDGIVEVYIDQTWSFVDISFSKIYEPNISDTSLIKTGGFKTSADHPFCLFYYDESLRRSNAQITTDMVTYVPSVNDYSPMLTTTNNRWGIEWEVSHEPPTWAKYWKWGYAGNRRTTNFVQYIISSTSHITTVVADSGDVANTVCIDITPLQTIRTTTASYWNCYPNSVIPSYSFVTGDRIRFMTESTDPDSGASGIKLGDAIDGIVDYEILKYDETTFKLYVKDFPYESYSIGENTLVEIYTPTKATTIETYYEFGDLMAIVRDVNGNLVHGGINQNQIIGTGSQPAKGNFDVGDVYHIMRTPSKPLSKYPGEYTTGTFFESMGWSDFYDSDDWNKGKLGLESSIGEVTNNIVRYSNVYLQNTNVNGITTFLANNYKELNDVYGNIISIVENGDTLKIYQEKKPSSILIGRTEYTDTSGSGNVVVSPSILGAIRYSTKNYGTEFPESISKNNRYVYGFDIYSGVIWRDSANGIFPISGRYVDVDGSNDYKMQTYFKLKSKALLESGIDHCHVMTVWDEEYKMLYVTFIDLVNEINNDTVVFHEPSNSWITFTEFEYTPTEGYNQILELSYSVVKGFENGIGYEWDEASRFAVFNIPITIVNSSVYPALQTVTITPLAPTVKIDCTVTPSLINLTLNIPNPEVIFPSISASSIHLSWTFLQTGVTDGVVVTYTYFPAATYYITNMPSWLTVLDSSGNKMSVGSQLGASGSSIIVYPTTVNTGARRPETGEDYLRFYSSVTTCQSILYVAHEGPPPGGTCSILMSTASDNVLQYVMNASGTCSVGSTTVGLSFIPYHPDYVAGETYEINWNAILNDTVNSGSGSFIVTEETLNNVNITITGSGIVYRDILKVYVSARAKNETLNALVSAALQELTISLLSPTVKCAHLIPSVLGVDWTATDYGASYAVTFTIDCGDAEETYVYGYPSWAAITDSDGNDLKTGHYIEDGETLSVYPITNNTGSVRTSSFIFKNEFGNIVSVMATQNAYVGYTPPVILVSSYDTTELFLMTREGSFDNLSNFVTLVVTPYISTYNIGEAYTLFWTGTINGEFSARGSFDAYQETQSTVKLYFPTMLSRLYDTVVINIAGNYI